MIVICTQFQEQIQYFIYRTVGVSLGRSILFMTTPAQSLLQGFSVQSRGMGPLASTIKMQPSTMPSTSSTSPPNRHQYQQY